MIDSIINNRVVMDIITGIVNGFLFVVLVYITAFWAGKGWRKGHGPATTVNITVEKVIE